MTKTTTVTPVCIQTVLLQTRFYLVYTIKNLKITFLLVADNCGRVKFATIFTLKFISPTHGKK